MLGQKLLARMCCCHQAKTKCYSESVLFQVATQALEGHFGPEGSGGRRRIQIGDRLMSSAKIELFSLIKIN